MRWRAAGFCLAYLLAPAPVRAGLYYSGEEIATLPSRWGGFLIDHRSLRAAAVDRPANLPPSPLRDRYLKASADLEAVRKLRPLTADELADLGALLVRLGKVEQALAILRPARQAHPDHFRIAANLGTAWQIAGDLEQAATAFESSVLLAPKKLESAEKYHLKLVRLRLKEGGGRAALKFDSTDDLFGVKFVAASSLPEAGRIAAREWTALPGDAVAVVQALALALPADGRLLWLLGELANAQGDVRTAAAILDGCVTEFGMAAPSLRARRQMYRAAAEEWAKKPDHETHRGTFAAKSPRPLSRHFDLSTLPPVRPDGPNPLPFGLLGEATIGAKGRPTFPKRLVDLDGKRVVLTGFMQPLGDGQEFAGFLLVEFPVGCWFCETPEPTGLVSVELGKRTGLDRNLRKVVGVLVLNRDNPEDFLFRVQDAQVGEPE